MLIGREKELQYLNNLYDRDGSRMIVLYGQKYIGKTSLIKSFMADKQAFYYVARPASYKEQCYRMVEEFSDLELSADEENFEAVLQAIMLQGSGKKILIIDEFQYMVKSSDDFMKSLVSLVRNEFGREDVFVILVSSSVGWVENSMVRKIKTAAYEIKGFLKLRELSFEELHHFFPKYSVRQCMEVYSILGAVPGLLGYFDQKLSVQENICHNILKKGCFLQMEGSRFVAEELRETSVYHAILSGLASGRQKLNDLYHYTGFSRAKISVYLNNLIELEIVEKVFSIDTEGRDNTMKGVYTIRNHFVSFWFQFIFPHLSKLEFMSEELFYDSYIAENLAPYCASYFGEVCREYIQRESKQGRLPIEVKQIGAWYGKAGSIDVVARNEADETILGICEWEKEVTYADFEWLGYCAEQARLDADYYYLFSGKGFDAKLKETAGGSDRIRLIEAGSMM